MAIDDVNVTDFCVVHKRSRDHSSAITQPPAPRFFCVQCFISFLFFLHNSLLACSSVCPRPIWRFRSGRDVILHQVFLARNHLLFDGVFKIARVFFFITADNLFVCAEPIVATHRRRTFGTHCGTQNKEKHRRKKKASSECSSKNKTRANLPGFPLNVNNYSPRWNVCLFVFSTGKNVIVY